MENLGILTIVAVLVAIILQLITISMVAGMRGKGRGSQGHHRRDGAGGEGGRTERKDGSPRGGANNNRKPGDNKGGQPKQQGSSQPRPPQPQNQSAAPDSGATLRDINLKLKNAEREQESARRKIQDGGPRDGGSRDERGPRDGGPRDGSRDGSREGSRDGSRDGRPPRQGGGPRGERGDRGDRGGDGRGDRGERGGRRDFNRDQRRDGGPRDGRPDGRPDRPPRGDGDGAMPGRPEFAEGHSYDRPPRPFPPADESSMMNVPASSYEAAMNNDMGASEELQHGRKFTAKRRQLPENGEADGAPPADVPVSTPVEAAPNFDAPMEQPQQDDGADIQFGRGRR